MFEKIKSSYVMKIILDYMKRKRALNIIKFNKKLLNKLNLAIKDFKVYDILEEYNQRFNLNIEDINITNLSLTNKKSKQWECCFAVLLLWYFRLS